MAKGSPIQWTDHTLNAIVGCFGCSTGCRFCYAIREVWRMAHNPKFGEGDNNLYAGLVEQKNGQLMWTGRIRFFPHKLYKVLRIRTANGLVFVNSLSDLFYERLPVEIIQEHLRVFRMAGDLQFQVLTKRPDRALQLEREGLIQWPQNVWLGTSVASLADKRLIDKLRQTSAHIKVISFEPLVEDVKLTPQDLAGIDWAIFGGESGDKHKARSMDVDWIRRGLQACCAADVPAFVKQLGTQWAIVSNTYSKKKGVRHRASGGDWSAWPSDLDDLKTREYPEGKIVSQGRAELEKQSIRTATPSDWEKWSTLEMERTGNPKCGSLVSIA